MISSSVIIQLFVTRTVTIDQKHRQSMNIVQIGVLASIFISITEGGVKEDYQNCLSIDDQCEQQICVVKVQRESMLYPVSGDIATGQTEALFFDPNVTGRITPTGKWTGRSINVEYLYGLTYGSDLTGGFSITKNVPIYYLCKGNWVSFRGDMLWGYTGDKAAALTNDCADGFNLTMTGIMQFNKDGTQITGYDLAIPWIRFFFEKINDCTANSFTFTNKTNDIPILCGAHQQLCIDGNSQFENPEKCAEFMNSIPFGDVSSTMSYNTVVCRELHLLFTTFAPDIHCPHLGNGSAVCVDRGYNWWYDWNLEYVDYETSSGSKTRCCSYGNIIIISIALLMMFV